MLNKFIVNFCTLFNLGFIKFMPGTFGSLVSLPIGYINFKIIWFLDIYPHNYPPACNKLLCYIKIFDSKKIKRSKRNYY